MADVVILSTRVPPATAAALDGKRGKLTRAEAMRQAIEDWPGPGSRPRTTAASGPPIVQSLRRDVVEPNFKGSGKK